MKKTCMLTLLVLCCEPSTSHGDDRALLHASEDWQKEIIDFPPPFAPALTLSGFADLRFPKGWGSTQSDYFWSYAFGWSLSDYLALEEEELEEYTRTYFDGLMGAVTKDKQKALPSTFAHFYRVNRSTDGAAFSGRITVFDAFFQEKPMTLNVVVDVFYCKSQKRTLALFKLSPKTIEHPVWKDLGNVALKKGVCE